MQTSSFTQNRIRNRNHIQEVKNSAFASLLIRYMDGEIADRSWNQIMNTIDQSGLTGTERMAFARFMNEMIEDAPNVDLHLPKPEEIEELMTLIRTSNSNTRH